MPMINIRKTSFVAKNQYQGLILSSATSTYHYHRQTWKILANKFIVQFVFCWVKVETFGAKYEKTGRISHSRMRENYTPQTITLIKNWLSFCSESFYLMSQAKNVKKFQFDCCWFLLYVPDQGRWWSFYRPDLIMPFDQIIVIARAKMSQIGWCNSCE